MHAPGPLLASGRDMDVFEYGPHLVLRRSRAERSQLVEARTMEFLGAMGYPVPEVVEIDADGRDLVMERVDGVTMVDSIARAPWTLRRRAHELAELHRRLHDIEAPAFLDSAPVGQGTSLVHMDLHPLNVLIGPRGPVVIDWTGASRGDPVVDVVLAWALMATGEVPRAGLEAGLIRVARGLLVRSFVSRFDRAAIATRLHDVVAWKVSDPHMSENEVRALWALAGRAGGA